MFSYAVVVCQAHPHPRREVSGFCYSASDDALCRSTAAKFFELPNSNAAMRRQLLATTIFTASAENLTDGSGNVIATVTTHCSSCTIELP